MTAELMQASPAKINLTLRVCGLRADGYHEIESLVAQVGLCDTITVRVRDDDRCTLSCADPAIPTDERNLALRAALDLARRTGAERGAHITLTKRIPAGTGLGGGSSNAATTLRLLNDLWRLGLSLSELADIGATIGSDVPLFLRSPLAIVRGRGAEIVDLSDAPPAWCVLVLPEIHAATPDVYAAWDRQSSPAQRPELTAVLAALGSAADLMPLLFNDLEKPACSAIPELAAFARMLHACSDAPLCMTGSGSAFFRLFDDERVARDFADKIRAATTTRAELVPCAPPPLADR
ncbi:MAG: 4-(cytidine 5'-diphospho)-2-C-methyl-D-erythritol kinase [Planctomycetes bacterium]|nr:4-(cytidine 5'-diphospho)-2-C-methyl-D-erythritol kinase [Planctomycetota bacterium]